MDLSFLFKSVNKIKGSISHVKEADIKMEEYLRTYVKLDLGANFEMAEKLNETAKECRKKAKIHIALETGTNRIGFKVGSRSIEDVKRVKRIYG